MSDFFLLIWHIEFRRLFILSYLKKIIGPHRDFDFGHMPKIDEFLKYYECDVLHVHWVCGVFFGGNSLRRVQRSRDIVGLYHLLRIDGIGSL